MEIKLGFSQVLAVIYLLLFLFGWSYNALVAYAERKHYSEGYMGFIVAFGVAVTMLPFAFFEQPVGIGYVYAAFVASGAPMILGSAWRHVKARAEGQHDDRQTAKVA